jgi:cell wall-associated NlpC family hydrolase
MPSFPFADSDNRVTRWHAVLLLALAMLTLAGCAEFPENRQPLASTEASTPSNSGVAAALYDQLDEWRSVAYRYGGTSKRGVDCSGFVYVTYLSRFGIRLPRSTETQAKAGAPVDMDRLRPGDLVFFHTGWGKRHVGIYVENERFIHASTSSGVTLSSLNNDYWSSHYWKAVRVQRLADAE